MSYIRQELFQRGVMTLTDTNLNDATHIKWLKTRKENKNGKQ